MYDIAKWNAVVESVRAEMASHPSRSGRSGTAEESPAPASAPSSVSFSSAMPDNLKPFFSCVAMHESGGNYGAVSAHGKYRGRYQMDANFWRSHAAPEWHYLLDPPAWETAPPEAQDAAAVHGYYNQGPGAWSGPNGAICVEYRI